MLQSFGAHYRGWMANACVPQAFATHRLTVHVPRRFYRTVLPGIPTIRVFEALACGIPLISAPWSDCEGLFRPGTDFLTASNADEMRSAMQAIAADDGLACQLIGHGWQRIRDHHTCRHRAQQLLSIATSITPSLDGGACMSLKISVLGSSLLSSYWNGAATYYRGIIRALRSPRLQNHLLRTGRIRSPVASRHRSAVLGGGRRLSSDEPSGADRLSRSRARRHHDQSQRRGRVRR